MGITFPLLEPASPSSGGSSAEAGRPSQPVSLIGSGIVQPFRRDEKNDFAHATAARLIGANIRQILSVRAGDQTHAGEVPWDGTIGSRLHVLTHRNGTPALDELARHWVVDAIRTQEPRARVTQVRQVRKQDRTVITVKFVPTDRTGRAIAEEQSVDVSVSE